MGQKEREPLQPLTMSLPPGGHSAQTRPACILIPRPRTCELIMEYYKITNIELTSHQQGAKIFISDSTCSKQSHLRAPSTLLL